MEPKEAAARPYSPTFASLPAAEADGADANAKYAATHRSSSAGGRIITAEAVPADASDARSRTASVAAQPMSTAGEGMSLTLKAVNPNDPSLQLTRSGKPVTLTATSSKDLKKMVDVKMKTKGLDRAWFIARTALIIISIAAGGFGIGFMMAAWGNSRGQGFVASAFYSNEDITKAKLSAKLNDPKSRAVYEKRVEREIFDNLATPKGLKDDKGVLTKEGKEILTSLIADGDIFDFLDPNNHVNQQLKQMRQTISNKEVEKSKLTDAKGITEAADSIDKLKKDVTELEDEQEARLTHALKNYNCTMKDRKDRTSSSPTTPTSKSTAATASSTSGKPAISLTAADDETSSRSSERSDSGEQSTPTPLSGGGIGGVAASSAAANTDSDLQADAKKKSEDDSGFLQSRDNV
jgi:hypothetical protein